MPIIVKDFKWRQTETLIIIQVPLHGIHQSKVDLLTSSNYIKASFAQFFFEAFLLQPVQLEDSKCTLTSTEIIFELIKEEPISWPKLEPDISKKDKMALKQTVIQREHESVQNKCKKRLDKKCELKREAVKQQISLDTKQRNIIDTIRNDEKTAAIGDLRAWNKNPTQAKIEEISSDEDEDLTPSNKNLVLAKIDRNIKSRPIKNVFKSNVQNVKNRESTPIPFPRRNGILQVDFTARQFPTPSRESQMDEENDWLKKQAEVRRTVGFVSEDLRAEEKNPQYLNSKGLEFLKSGNYLGAISAFSFGIRLTEKYSDLFVNRSKAHFEIGNYYKSVQDCSTALDLLQPVVSANYNTRVDCIVRRGMALCKLEFLREGVTELEAAYKLRSDDDSIKQKLCEAIDQLNSVSAN